MYDKVSDAELTALLKEGDHEAFTQIFNRYNSLLYIHAFKKLNERESAKDVVQEVFSSLWIKRELINPGNNLGGYLYTAVKHRIFDLLSHQKVTNKHVISLQKYLEHGQVVRADYQIREKQLAAIIEKEIAALPSRMREVFMLSRNENLTHREIAERLAISEQTVTDQVKKALKILKPKIGLSIALMMSGMI